MWQDWTIAAVQWGFALALIPTVRPSAPKPSIWTSAPTALGMYVIAFTMMTLGLWWSAASALVGATLWTVIALQTRTWSFLDPEQWRRENRK